MIVNSTKGGTPMVSAYVLIQTDVGKASTVVDAIGNIDGVVSAQAVTGPYDIIVKTQAEDVDSLGKLVVARVQAVAGITRTLTCPVITF
jgi:DNA-binding Lrp family transcriptional regulator